MIEILISESRRGTPLSRSEGLRSIAWSEHALESAVRYARAHPDHTAYHLLFAMRRNAPDEYASLPDDVVARVLCDTLGHQTSFNDWGYLDPDGSHDGEAAVALLEVGRASLPWLLERLDDDQPAPLLGSEPATLSKLYGYRVKDFAYRYASLILHGEARFDASAAERDAQIARLRSELRASLQAEEPSDE